MRRRLGEPPAARRPGAVARAWRRPAPDEHVRTLTVRGRVLRVAARGGNPQSPPLVLCNGIGARLELLQPFVDALGPRREVVRFDMPGTGGSPDPVLPYHLWTLAPLLSGLLDQLGYQQATSWASPGEAGSRSNSPCGTRTGCAAWCWWPPPPGQ